MSKLRLIMLIVSFFTLISLSVLIIFDPEKWLAYFLFQLSFSFVISESKESSATDFWRSR